MDDKIFLARAATLKKAPYFSTAVYSFVYVPIEGIGTMLVTDRMVLGYDPIWAAQGSIDELAADIAHETHHFLRRHFERMAGYSDKQRANIAADLAINPDLIAAGWKLSSDAILPKHFDLPEGKTLEEYYQLLENKTSSAPGAGSGGEGNASPRPGIATGNCGSISGGSSGKIKEIEDKLNETPGLGRDLPEMRLIEKRIAADIKHHAEKNGRGSVPEHLHDFVGAFETPSYIRWQEKLANIIRDTTGQMQAGGEDFSLRHPSKQSLLGVVLRPGMVEYTPEVCFIRDSSGSMGVKQLTDAAREAYGIMQALGIDEVWFADADVGTSMPWKRVGPQFFRTLQDASGRGGTDFRPGLEAAQKLTPKPDIIVYLTDGDGTAPKYAPSGVAVIWVIVPSYYNRAPASWGHTVFVSDDPAVQLRTPIAADEDE